MNPEDMDDTVVRARLGSAGGKPEDLEADTVIRASSRAAGPRPGTLVSSPAPVAPPVLVEPPAPVAPPAGDLVVVDRSELAQVRSVADPEGQIVRHHHIRVNRHEPIPLDAPALIGRKPVSPRIQKGEVPRLVRVPSPGREVSSTHVELRQQGASVIVTDLRSTNGTVVLIPGASAQKLRQGESLVVSAGTVVDIGDGNTVEILPIERLV